MSDSTPRRPPRAVKVGDRVRTPIGAGVVAGFKRVTVWYGRGPRNRQMVVVDYPNGRQRPWFPDRLELEHAADGELAGEV